MRSQTRKIAVVTALTLGTVGLGAGTALAQDEVAEPDSFTSMFTVMATPDTIINMEDESVPGEEGASGTYNFRINSDEEIICYDITLDGVTPPYESPAVTATHIHEAAAGSAGPPRLAFPNPEGNGEATSSGCLQAPFVTGVAPEGTDTGEGFSLAEIEANPAGFFADVHTAEFTAGAVRGQLMEGPMGGVETGAGGSDSSAAPIAIGAAALIGAAGVGFAMKRRRAEG